ncbi:MAG: DUF1080 domain-containing protein [Puniceicoccales bacterium]|jgi:hypothetical protein|nr:DUF1080 domain-containing protein [Puniceicoccales bacterium]
MITLHITLSAGLALALSALCPLSGQTSSGGAHNHANETTPAPGPINQLTAEETAAGWQLLWNGTDSTGWRSIKGVDFPKKGWEIKDGVLSVLKHGGGGDIITAKQYANFELSVDFKTTPGANSGIKYFVQHGLDKHMGIGLEYQILDDARHPDAKLGKNGNRKLGSLYDLIPAPADKPAPSVGVWHTARLVVKGAHVEHWFDGVKVVEYDRHSEAFRAAVKASKYKGYKHFGEWETGHILLQDHGDNVSFRNIKIRDLK